ncbi:hypothetical protein POM88_010079 [Heracleum sosnowskyi]|uniref:Myb/SANT-like domain-containing protein n=1 Tax=Heracleum sosnowskyi TaxID=360622 RepID=A0AAD8N916_9APIA|nr:hypothetical protein POM88_010079 [Heracleum sosnowskyi]
MDQSNKTQNQSNETQKKGKVYWRGELITKTFLEACIEEVTASGRLGSSVKPHSWITVGEILKKTHGFEVDARQMRNRYDYLRNRYVVWCQLKSKTGNHYNPGPSSKRSRTVDANDEKEIPDIEEIQSNAQNALNLDAEETPKKRTKTSPKLAKITEFENEMTTALKLMVQANSGPSLKECKKKLNSLGWGATSPLHKMALGIFCESAKYREQWMLLEDNENADWVKMVSTKLGFNA